jgi:hypothetical protein
MDMDIARLLKAYPGGAKVADKQGFLPIHVACRCGMSLPVIQLLVQTAPGTLKNKTKKGSTPYTCARQMKGAHKKDVLDFLRTSVDGGTASSSTADEIEVSS